MLIDYCETARLHERETGELKEELLRQLQTEYNKSFSQQLSIQMYGGQG